MHNREMAHRHPSLPDVCETCRFLTAYEPPDDDEDWTLPVIAAGVALAMLLAGFAWLVLAAFR